MEATLVVLAALACIASGASWDYYRDHDTGISHWHDMYAACGGNAQSPIHIYDKYAEEKTALNTLLLTGYDTTPVNASTMQNNGHTIQAAVNQDAYIENGELPGRFKLAQYHMHWGSGNNNGSEHWIDGKHYAAEIHFVHVNTKYASIGDSLSYGDGLAVLGVMIEVSGSDNPAYEKLISKVSSIPYADSSHATLDKFQLQDLLPSNRTVFYRYAGSLTTPPCSEAVTWTVFATPIQLSSTQMTKLRTLLSELTTAKANNASYTAADYLMYDNHRLPMPLNDRTVYVSKAAPESCTSHAHTVTSPAYVITAASLIAAILLHHY